MADGQLGTPHLRFEIRHSTAWCFIDRPEARNALTPSMYRGLGLAVRLAATVIDLNALVITGTQDVFVSGGDMGSDVDGREDPQPPSAIVPFAIYRDSTVPIVAAINGRCHASGLLFAMLSDVAIASDRATFRAPELIRGFADTWLAAVLPAHVGVGRARELAMTAREIDAQEALAIGLVERVVEHERLTEAANAAALELAEAAPIARATWRHAVSQRYGPIDQAAFDAAGTNSEVTEGFRSFKERRPPAWSPRCKSVGARSG